MNITAFENAALIEISKSDFMDGLTGPDAVGKQIWADCSGDDIVAKTEITRKQLSGVISSLSKKQLINFFEDGKDSTWSLTSAGAAIVWPEAYGGEFPIAD